MTDDVRRMLIRRLLEADVADLSTAIAHETRRLKEEGHREPLRVRDVHGRLILAPLIAARATALAALGSEP